jgi:transposase
MFQTHSHRQGSIELVNIEDLVPQDHLLRKIDATIDFSFIAEKTRPLYCKDNGRPCVDPVMLFKMLFIGYLYGIRSERRLVEEVRVNVAYRWFVGLSLTDKVPHATTFSQNRRRRFNGTTIFQEIFDEIVLQAINHGLNRGERTVYGFDVFKGERQQEQIHPSDGSSIHGEVCGGIGSCH